jgi:phage terminase small subunit
MVQARSTILKEGLTVQGRDAVKTHPAIAIERDSRTAFERALRELGLDAPAEPPRPPQLPGSEIVPCQ